MSERECGWPVGDHLVTVRGDDGSITQRMEPYGCSKPARVLGEDGVLRCVQHDRKSRGLSGKWSTQDPIGREVAG